MPFRARSIVGELLTEAGYVTMLIADTPHLMRDGHRFDRGLPAASGTRGREGDRAITARRSSWYRLSSSAVQGVTVQPQFESQEASTASRALTSFRSMVRRYSCRTAMMVSAYQHRFSGGSHSAASNPRFW